MRMTLCGSVALMLCAFTTTSADAFYGCCVPAGYYTYQTYMVTCYQPQWAEEKVPCVIQKVSYRKEVNNVKVQVYVAKMFDEKVRTSYYVPQPKVVECDVVRCVMVPVPVFDPCTCCCYMSYQPSYVTQKVQYTVCDYKLESRDDVVKVCRMVPEERMFEQVRYIPVVTNENSWTVRRTCVMVPYQRAVCVPVWVPCCP